MVLAFSTNKIIHIPSFLPLYTSYGNHLAVLLAWPSGCDICWMTSGLKGPICEVKWRARLNLSPNKLSPRLMERYNGIFVNELPTVVCSIFSCRGATVSLQTKSGRLWMKQMHGKPFSRSFHFTQILEEESAKCNWHWACSVWIVPSVDLPADACNTSCIYSGGGAGP